MTVRAPPGGEYVAEAQTVHYVAEAQTDLATVRDAMEATDEALARKEQEVAYGRR